MIVIAGLLLCAGVWWLLNGGAKKMGTRYADTDFARNRTLAKNIDRMAAILAESPRPPEGKVQELHIDSNDWGHPIQYGWENDVALVRAAGKDGMLHTGDDIT